MKKILKFLVFFLIVFSGNIIVHGNNDIYESYKKHYNEVDRKSEKIIKKYFGEIKNFQFIEKNINKFNAKEKNILFEYLIRKEEEYLISTGKKLSNSRKKLTKNEKNIVDLYNSKQNFLREGLGKKVNKFKSYNSYKYDYEKAVNYALKYLGKRNKKFNYYKGKLNCTNYTSQVLDAGGIPRIGFYTYRGKRENDKWDYNEGGFLGPSYTWGAAPNFYRHAFTRSDVYRQVSNLLELRLGDIVQIDYKRDGSIEHSMVVTEITGNGREFDEIYVSYNSSYDNVNEDNTKSLQDIIDGYDGKLNFYGWNIIY